MTDKQGISVYLITVSLLIGLAVWLGSPNTTDKSTSNTVMNKTVLCMFPERGFKIDDVVDMSTSGSVVNISTTKKEQIVIHIPPAGACTLLTHKASEPVQVATPKPKEESI